MSRSTTKAETSKSKTAPQKTTKSSVPRKAAPKKTVAKASPATPVKGVSRIAPVKTVVTAAKPVVATPAMRKKELIDAVVAKSGIKKKDAKPVIEAMLAVLGTTLADGRELNLQPLGKLKINKVKPVSNGVVIVNRIRQSSGKAPLAKATE